MSNITVFGTGSFGSALANVLAENKHHVLMWGKNQSTIDEINTQHTNVNYLKDAQLDTTIKATTHLDAAIDHSDIFIIALPTKAIREVMGQVNEKLHSKKSFIHVTKGIENGTFKRVSEMLEDTISPDFNAGIGILSGPSHAEEVVIKQPTTVAAASENPKLRQLIQDLFMTDYLRVYTNDDLVGVELGGALKNIIAIASGVVSGMGYGDNAKAALITRGLAEITRLGVKLGADPLTFQGLGGIGDLIVTCTSTHSRNFSLGYKLGKGQKLDDILKDMNMVAEGVYTTQSVYNLAQQEGVEMPITKALYRVLFEDQPVEKELKILMGRDKKAE
ncbi:MULTISPECIES: NAD(P)H-dependent glycerol-3-phosphate dehydrogenase [Staphylococcus]|uniref:NAD(P)H-dependent glycerol-3-phosphate dehydrogenase n=1 Tax=Staphylococcus TaxID=1279 RepID=UPI000CCFF8A0|nr:MULTISPECIES: NAD(P)H-dependent glycerol-3-phosphate dehydrogenase [Staphylococcus]MBY7664077.1 NAD(P)H-dependent glycerol-3-phosphate dehydrogenase [Staphylococcus agnetis]MCO4326740.1 NAD(P)H-dependent glycerol-3-phosphate dehydrogenase [Staphylococcus agnetis]MCO4357630.1 NAD(P)H-dependent glycerol-3-phosphate dehydrogenase [Staphylococcus agnetis]MCO4362742.1 NAD(P)H-dependent glycerol-3-phosphate dehydrogenase [Staphylococcus agnetis]MCO4369807.1 NAD(P)H-dependent glycerol-3-phosphate 